MDSNGVRIEFDAELVREEREMFRRDSSEYGTPRRPRCTHALGRIYSAR